MGDAPSAAVAGLLQGQVALIAGVGPGLGRDLAVTFGAAGADVVLAARNPDHLDPVADEVAGLGRRPLPLKVDVTDADAVHELAARAVQELGRLDTVVYNAFMPSAMATVVDGDADEWQHGFDVNVTGAVRLAQATASALAERNGSIVMINSQAARRSQPRRGAYSASKAALLSLARTLAGELGRNGVRVNSVVPGHIWGPPLERFFQERAERLGTTPEDVYDEVSRDMALRRIATGMEVASTAIYLASPLASAVTGQSLDVNAGNWFE